jgi:uncharacterized membrane protein
MLVRKRRACRSHAHRGEDDNMGMPPTPEQPGQGYPGYPPQGQQPGYPPQPPSGYPPQGPAYPPPGAGYPPPPGYAPQGPQGQGYPGYPPPQPPRPGSASRWGPTSIGLDPAIGAGLSYLVPILGLIFFLVEKNNRFLRFHAMQAFLMHVVSFVIWIPISIVVAALSAPSYTIDPNTGVVTSGGALAGLGCLSCVVPLLGLAIFAVWIIALINAFQGKYFKIPVLGNFAENIAGGPAQPLF